MRDTKKRVIPVWGILAALTWVIYFLATPYSVMMISGEVTLLQGSAVSLISSGLCYAIAYLVFVVFYKFKGVKGAKITELSSSDQRTVRIIAICTGLGTLATVASMFFISASISGALGSLYPMGSLLLMMIIKRTKLSKVQKIGTFAATGGAVLISLAPGLGTSTNYLVGCFLALIPSAVLSLEAYLCDEALEGDITSESLTYFKAKLSSLYFSPFVVMSIIYLIAVHSNFAIGLPAILGIFVSGLMMTVSYVCYFRSFEKEGAVLALCSNVMYAVILVLVQLALGAVGVNSLVLLGALLVVGANIAISTKG